MARKKPAPKTPRPYDSPNSPPADGPVSIYTFDVFLMQGPVTEAFAKKNPVLRRTIEILGHQTLADLHRAIFTAFNREEEHLYEFQFGTRPMDPRGVRYVLPAMADDDDGARIGGVVNRTRIVSLHLKTGDRFGYWFDFGDSWWHQINVAKVEEIDPQGQYPRLISSEGESPPQYADFDEEPSEPPPTPRPKKPAKKAPSPRKKPPRT